MRALVQRVTGASVSVGGATVGSIGPGMLILLGVAAGDTTDDASRLAAKCASLRIFDDAEVMNIPLKQNGDRRCRITVYTHTEMPRGNRPFSYAVAAPSENGGNTAHSLRRCG